MDFCSNCFLNAHLIFTYLISSIVIFLVLGQFSFIKTNHSRLFWGLSFGLGPIFISWILACLLALFPKQSNLFYLSIIYTLFLFMLSISYKAFPLWISGFKAQFFHLRRIEKFVLMIIVFLLILNFLLIVVIPNFFSDSLDYMHMAKIIAKNRDLSLYPMVSSHTTRSLIASWTHPVGYMGVYVWTYLGSPVLNLNLSLQITSYFYAVSLLLAFISFFDKKDILLSLLSCLLLMSTPLYFYQVYQASIDPIRCYTFCIALMFLTKIIQFERESDNSFKNYLLLGFLLGMACFSHSIGFLSLPIACAIYFLLSSQAFLIKIRNITLFCMIPILIIAPRFWVNYKTFHSLITDTSPVWGLKTIEYNPTLNIIRGLGTSFERIFYGLFKGFTKIKIFGVAYWIMIGGLVFFKFNFQAWKKKDFYQSSNLFIFISALVVLCFYSMALVSFLLNMNLFIKNDRYILTMQPFVALVAGYMMYNFYQRYCEGRQFI